MSFSLDQRLKNTGTRFLIFPQARHLPSFKNPEVVVVSLPPGAIQPGPADDRMFVVNAIDKLPYWDGEKSTGEPPWLGRKQPPVQPNARGHFDELDADSEEFSCATMYATVRRVLDIWEDYFGQQIPWSSAPALPKLELLPLTHYTNATSGNGFLEFGFAWNPDFSINLDAPFCQNFDVLAHELGHNILYSMVGGPQQGHDTLEYHGFQESGGDLTAIVGSLHFDSVIDHLLEHSGGNLFTVNELSRLGELPDGDEIRRVFNDERMSTVIRTRPHDLSLPLTGAIFDVFVEAFQGALVAKGLITADLAERSEHGSAAASELPGIDAEFDAAYAANPAGFKACLIEARDYLGKLLATTWSTLSPDDLSYERVGRALLRADFRLTAGRHAEDIRECFAWREVELAALPAGLPLRGDTSSARHACAVHRTPAPQVEAATAD